MKEDYKMIRVEFLDFEDMVKFARQLLGQSENAENPSAPAPQPMPSGAATSVPVAPMPTSPVASAPVTPSVPVTPTAVPQTSAGAVQTMAATYTPDDLARAAFALMDSGRQQELIGLLQQFGVNAIPELKPEQYGAFATALRGMGAQI